MKKVTLFLLMVFGSIRMVLFITQRYKEMKIVHVEVEKSIKNVVEKIKLLS
jgi:hypothetical protein